MHTAFERDNYVQIFWENIEPNAMENFDKYPDFFFSICLVFPMILEV